jgi:hypothetical protein
MSFLYDTERLQRRTKEICDADCVFIGHALRSAKLEQLRDCTMFADIDDLRDIVVEMLKLMR